MGDGDVRGVHAALMVPLRRGGCYAMIFGEMHVRKITGYRQTDRPNDGGTNGPTDGQTLL